MRITFFQWGIHAWAIYAVVALSLAYFAYRHNLPLRVRSALYPLIGDRVHDPLGHAVDAFAALGTIFGLATSLGLGVMQINAGLNYLFGLEVSTRSARAGINDMAGYSPMVTMLGLPAYR
ncbi:choline-glycine betaine transporter [Xanthomonas campestris]|nr:choline-glycine betaine transporter [Xanthomonas euroxanthea]